MNLWSFLASADIQPLPDSAALKKSAKHPPNSKNDVTDIVALVNSSVNLPCDISLPNNQERVTLILWYREDLGLPIYR